MVVTTRCKALVWPIGAENLAPQPITDLSVIEVPAGFPALKCRLLGRPELLFPCAQTRRLSQATSVFKFQATHVDA